MLNGIALIAPFVRLRACQTGKRSLYLRISASLVRLGDMFGRDLYLKPACLEHAKVMQIETIATAYDFSTTLGGLCARRAGNENTHTPPPITAPGYQSGYGHGRAGLPLGHIPH